MTNWDKNIWIHENVYGYDRHESSGRLYWKKGNSYTCYLLPWEDFYPSPNDDNRILPNYCDDFYINLISYFKNVNASFNIWYNPETNYYFMEVNGKELKLESLPILVIDHILIFNGVNIEN